MGRPPMIMSALYANVLLAASSLVGLAAAAELPVGSFAQLGVAGMSLGLLFVVFTKTLPSVVRDIMAGHEKANAKVCEKLDEVKVEIAAGREDYLKLLREAIEHRGRR